MEFLGQPGAYRPVPSRVDRIETHASFVFLAGDRAYKVKRAVRYPFLDFSTLEKRHAACCKEFALNRRTAVDLYLEVVPVTRGRDGTSRLGGEGEAMEWVLVMRRFNQASLYDRMAVEGRLSVEAMTPLGREVARVHAGADRFLKGGLAVPPLAAVLEDNQAAFAGHSQLFPPDALAELGRAACESLASVAPLLNGRTLSGFVRRCHGDLHLRNIVEIKGRPVLFDAIEFDDALATIDVLYDLAFLLMDLGARGLNAHANALLNAYLDADWSTCNLLGLKALPLFLSLRAMVRAKVELLRAEQGSEPNDARDRAGAYFALARDYLRTTRPLLIAIGGLSGSGKSSVARALASRLGTFPGAVHVRSDRERKRLFGVSPEEKLPRSAYTQDITDTVYAACRKRAALALKGARAVIVDAVHARPEEREHIAAVAGVPFVGLWLEVPAALLKQRVGGRGLDTSDATPAIVEQQLTYDIGPQTFVVVDASGPLEHVVLSCLREIRERAMHPGFTAYT